MNEISSILNEQEVRQLDSVLNRLLVKENGYGKANISPKSRFMVVDGQDTSQKNVVKTKRIERVQHPYPPTLHVTAH